MRLDRYDNGGFDRGRPALVEGLWWIAQGCLFATWLPGSGWRVALLRLFGARIGRGCVIKPRVRVKFPWRLLLGDHVWLGESVWIDNLAEVRIGSHCCVSQGVYLCTGNHDHRDEAFRLLTAPIVLEDEVWLGALCVVAPGVVISRGTVVRMGSRIFRRGVAAE
jgi:putative colanic acid biosynthesis acetyltransferase WcaF